LIVLGVLHARCGVCISIISKININGKKQFVAIHASPWTWSSLVNFLDTGVQR